ncbi:DUF2520 domain-containing protein [Patulibacter sp. SYSU D01012]|uniref:DUF2520 domain-containing protein n=1 Tax=Patulibacter sp. SYSU D01012 TaxID=2817381 RepID=UPI001B3045C6|nr:DUF2520 domain-containing protein [Patulibacter sp. SYSU D01012]
MTPCRSAPADAPLPRCSVVGRGRLGGALAAALRAAGAPVDGPHGRGHDGADADVVLLCVPDGEIAAAAAAIVARPDGPLVGHVSGATTLAPLDGHEAFSLHPLMTVPGPDAALAGAPCAVAAATPRALAVAERLAVAVGMRPLRVDDADRAAYHAAASVAANFLVTLEDLATRLAADAGVDRTALAPLVRAAVDAWQERGAADALTGPVARGDDATVARQRAAVAARGDAGDLELFDVLTAATARLAARGARPGGSSTPTPTAVPAGSPA